MERARANGQPTIAAVAKKAVTSSVRWGFLELDGSMLNADARVTKYIAKEDGRNANRQICLGSGHVDQLCSKCDIPTEAFHIPELVSIMKNIYLATRQLTFSRTIR